MCRRRKWPDFVRDDAGKLGLVAHPQEKTGEDDRKAGREHHRVEIRNVRQIDAHVLRRGPADVADDALQVGDELRVLDQQVGARDLLLDPVHLLPEAHFVRVRRPEARADQRDHVGRRIRAWAMPVAIDAASAPPPASKVRRLSSAQRMHISASPPPGGPRGPASFGRRAARPSAMRPPACGCRQTSRLEAGCPSEAR